METSWAVYGIGFLAQLLFSARTLVQWIKSEKSRTVQSPSSYWILSVAGSYLFMIYGWLRNDFAILFGQFLSYYIYLWNLGWKGIWQKTVLLLKILLLLTPPAAVFFVLKADAAAAVARFLPDDQIPLPLMICGVAGQMIFTFRFVYQWIFSSRRKESLLPSGFWIISLLGSAIIIVYGIFRCDPVLILGQSFGLVAYLRNIMIGHGRRTKRKKENLKNESTC